MTRSRWALLWGGLATTYALTSRGTNNVDLEAAMLPAWSLATLGTVFPPADVVGDNPWFIEVDDRLATDRQPGSVLPLVPFYAVARLLGSEAFSTWPGSVFAAMAVATAVVLLVHALSALVPINVALIAGLVVALASPVWTVAANGPWPHTVDVLLIAGALHALSRKRLWFAGCWLALLVPTRPLLAVAVAVLGAVLSLRQRSPRPLLAIGAPSFVGLLVLRVVSCLTLPGLGRFSYGESSCAGADAA